MNQTFENCTLLDTKSWFNKARPHKTIGNFTVQLGVHFEEVGEMTAALGGQNQETQDLLDNAHAALNELANHLKANPGCVNVVDRLEMLDGLCDQIVTGTGVAHTLDYDIVGAMTEVNRSNFSKFGEDGEPIYNEQGKIMKGPNYSKAELSAYLPE
jgi:predicted HAD superfamily Cof-like phosphohydrolase